MDGSRRDWLVPYLSVWTTYGALYLLLFVAFGVPPHLALLATVCNAVPGALVGLAVVRVLDRHGAARGAPWRTALLHVSLALGFAVVTSAATFAVFLLWALAARGSVESSLTYQELMYRLWQGVFTLFVYAVLAAGVEARRATARMRDERERADRAESLRAQAELQALRAQLNPHFLFNTLHSLLALVRRDATAAEEAIEQFGELLRYSLHVTRREVDEVPLAEEWRFTELYLALERLRLGERLRVVEAVDPDALDVLIPPFSIQTLVENAIRHAIAPRARGGTVWIDVAVRGGALSARVRDDGPGAEASSVRAGEGLGLRLVEQRLRVHHGPAARLDVETAEGAGFAVSVTMPARRARAAGVEEAACESAL